jgi:hypothetical protein
MDLSGLLAAMTATGVISVGAAHYLSRKLVDHRLSKDLKDYDAEISARLASHKAALDKLLNEARAENEAKIKKELEEYLGERAAERSYRSEARKRLYLAVGPLRFQLIVAATEFANRVARIGGDEYTYDLNMSDYFGQSTAYRMLRVLAICELVERQIAYADFAVDPEMRSLLKFKRFALLALSSSRVSLGHSMENWNEQVQHVFYDVLGIIASSMITQDAPSAPARVIRFDEFANMISHNTGPQRIHPIPRLLSGFTAEAKPIFWLRLLALAQLCIGLQKRHGSEVGFEIEEIDTDELLDQTKDNDIAKYRGKYCKMLRDFREALGNADA